MFEGNLTDLNTEFKNIYDEITGERPICAVSGAERPFTEEEESIMGADRDPAVLFDPRGQFKMIGFRGHWYKLLSYTHHDFDKVFCAENLRITRSIDGTIGENRDGEQIARLAV